MASFADLSLRYRIFMSTYRYRSCDWSLGAELTKPLSDSNMAVVTTAAFYAPDQEAFDESAKGGDVSYRVISSDTDRKGLHIGHRSSAFDPAGIIADKNLALPLDRLQELRAAGNIGSLKEVTQRVKPPRALFVGLPLGYPLGRPGDANFQKRIIAAAFRLLEPGAELPLLEEFHLEEMDRAT